MFLWISEFLAGLFALWSIGFWVLVVLFSIIMFATIELGYGGWATITMILTALIVHYFVGIDLYALVSSDPWWAAGLVGAYLLVGVVWSMAKWWFFTRRAGDKAEEFLADIVKRNGEPKSNKEKKDLQEHIWRELRTEGYKLDTGEIRVWASNYKSRIMSWMGGWPFSMLWTIIDDPVKRLFKYMYRRLQHIYEGISERNFRKVEGVLAQDPNEEKEKKDEDESRESPRSRRI